MRTKKILINEKPIPQARPRVTRFTTYDPRKNQKVWIRQLIHEQYNDTLSCPLEVDFKFFLPIPKSVSRKIRERMKSGLIPHIKRPDIDNYLILYLNAMTGIVYSDDNQVYAVSAKKEYSENPRTEITIKWENL